MIRLAGSWRHHSDIGGGRFAIARQLRFRTHNLSSNTLITTLLASEIGVNALLYGDGSTP